MTIRVRRRAALGLSASAGSAPRERQYLTRAAYAKDHSASPEGLAAVADFARSQGLVVLETSAARRSVFVSGMAADYTKAFGTQIAD